MTLSPEELNALLSLASRAPLTPAESLWLNDLVESWRGGAGTEEELAPTTEGGTLAPTPPLSGQDASEGEEA